MINAKNIAEIDNKLQKLTPQVILQEVLAAVPGITISFSGAEDVALVVMAWKIKKDIKIFALDTGRLHSETYQFIDRFRSEYKLDIEFLYPDTASVEKLTRKKRAFSASTRMVTSNVAVSAKLNLYAANLRRLTLGLPANARIKALLATMRHVDTLFAGQGRTLLKFNPFANWRPKDVWDYIRIFDIPYNPLHDQGMVSIGCQPCTCAIGPNQHEREGRWWWEEATAKECGLHNINPIR